MVGMTLLFLCGSGIKMLKMLVAVGGLFSVSFLLLL